MKEKATNKLRGDEIKPKVTSTPAKFLPFCYVVSLALLYGVYFRSNRGWSVRTSPKHANYFSTETEPRETTIDTSYLNVSRPIDLASKVLKSERATSLSGSPGLVTSQRRLSNHSSPAGGVAFIKTHKTGSTTIGHIMNRFGYQRNLSFVLSKRLSNGHLVYTKITKDSPKNLFLKPLNVEEGDYERYKYDMITVHIRYFREAMDTFMKPNTHYITILRDPGTQFESAFVHFQMDDAFPAPVKEKLKSRTISERLREWFRHPKEYLNKLKQLKYENNVGLRFYYAQNNQLFDMGLDVRYHDNETKVRDYIARLSRELDMVIITEYIEESLLVLKKQFGWELEDILFISKNERTERAKDAKISESLRNQMREWNSLDYLLYQHFNSTLWRKVEEYGPDFDRDLADYKKRLSDVFEKCTNGSYRYNQGRYFQNINYSPAKDAGQLCLYIAEHKRSLMKRVRMRQLQDKT